jgi:hypothetical protein
MYNKTEFPVIQAQALGWIGAKGFFAAPSRDARDLLSIDLGFRAGLGVILPQNELRTTDSD